MSEPGYYTSIGAYRDRLRARELPDDICQQKIVVVMTDGSAAPDWGTIRPAVCRLPADRARELACQLLALAEAVEQWELAR